MTVTSRTGQSTSTGIATTPIPKGRLRTPYMSTWRWGAKSRLPRIPTKQKQQHLTRNDDKGGGAGTLPPPELRYGHPVPTPWAHP